jgi:NhaA family Na+:H+ antiporter
MSESTDARSPSRALQEFLATEVGSGVILLAATVVALVWVNSPWGESYEQLWHTRIAIHVGGWSVSEDLRHWVNEGLMTLFFFVVGLEVKWALTIGDLRIARAAILPIVAAVGGMAVPALIYLAFNPTGEASRGWGIPMATDIAFALGVLALAGRRIPLSLRTFLLALAIVDDIGAIIVIALFYSGDIGWDSLVVAGLLLLVLAGLWWLSVRLTLLYVALGVAVWFATFRSGIHPTLAGVALGLLTPARPLLRPATARHEATWTAAETSDVPQPPDADSESWLRLSSVALGAVSPLARLEHLLHPWTSRVVIPIFALANAGVRISADSLAAAMGSTVTWGIVAGLVIGKVVGISGAGLAAVKIRVAHPPQGSAWSHMVGVGAVAGIGFTVSLFIADLAFRGQALEEQAKIGVLVASLTSGVVGSLVLRAGWHRNSQARLRPGPP